MSKPSTKGASAFNLSPTDDLNDLRMTEKAMPLYEHVKRFITETVEPMSEKYHATSCAPAHPCRARPRASCSNATSGRRRSRAWSERPTEPRSKIQSASRG